MRNQFWVLERHKWQLIWEGQQGLSAQAASTKAHRWPYPESPLQPWTLTHPSRLCWMRKVQSIRTLWWPRSLPSTKGQALAVGRCPAARHSSRGGGCGGSGCCSASCTSPSALPPANHLQCFWICPRTLPDRLCGAGVSRAVADPRARRDSKHRVQALTPPFVPAACRAWHGTQNHPGQVFYPALSPTSTCIPSGNIRAWCLLFPQRAQSHPVPGLHPSAHLESNQGGI